MLTRLEVNGFKNLVDFALDFGPYTCIAGPNGVGKSNIFDAIRFLSLLTQLPINEAALQIRGAGGGNVAELFYSDGSERRQSMSFAAEMLVSRRVWDDFGREAAPSSSFLRYEVGFRYEPAAKGSGPLGGLVLEWEELRPITAGRAARHLKFPHSKHKFRDSVVYNKRHARSGFISTRFDETTNENCVEVHQDSGAQGWGRPAPASKAIRTILGTENTAATPTILAARVEMQRWRVLALDPKALRKPDRYTQPAGIGDDGAHLPATLQHLSNTGDQPDDHQDDGIIAALSRRLADIAPVKSVRLVVDDVEQVFTIAIEESDGLEVRVDAISDGTLRFLGLATLALGAAKCGVICLEEPENGVYPTNLPHLSALLWELSVDPNEEVNEDNSLRQTIAATHSAAFVKLQDKDDLVLAKRKPTPESGDDSVTRVFRCVPHRETWRCSDGDDGFDLDSLEPFATHRASAQIAFPREIWEPEL